MMNFFIVILLFVSCSHHVVQRGGQKSYLYDPEKNYTQDELKNISTEVVMTSQRNPPDLFLEEYLKLKPAFKNLGIIVFESELQPTRGGLAGEDMVYLSASGKQLLTEKFLNVWEEVLTTSLEISRYTPVKDIVELKKTSEFGSSVPDYLYSSREKMDAKDVLLKRKGEKTTLKTTLSPRKFRDLSLLLVPASELMGGPKWSEHQKHFVNEVSKELKLDAVLVIYSKVNWTSKRIDKHTGESFGDNLIINVSASLLTPLSVYREKAISLGVSEPSSVSLCLGSYSVSVKRPLKMTIPKKNKLKYLEDELFNPMFKTYSDLVFMMIQKVNNDFKDKV